jgi:hypothetical protein
MPLNANREIELIRSNVPGVGPLLANALDVIVGGVNSLAQNIGGDTQTLPPPPTIQGLTVQADNNGNVHAVINDQNEISKNVHYMVEWQPVPTNGAPVFSQPHVEFLGPSRTMRPIPFAGLDGKGNPQGFIFRAYSQHPSGLPGVPVHFGGTTPTIVSVGGTGQVTYLPSTGSGTAPPSGTIGGSGFGKTLFRGPQKPKRQS